MKRSKHGLSYYKLLTCDMGKLVPAGKPLDVLPGDTIQMSSSILLRMSPMLSPVMHPVTVRMHHWFVPYRILWADWEDFITGGPDGLGAASGYPAYGPFTVPANGLLDYFGVPPGIAYPTGSISLLPTRAYNKVYNEFYRDEDLVAEVSQDTATVNNVAWEKDYFTSARPWTQKGPAVTLPIGASAPVMTQATEHTTGARTGMKARKSDGTLPAMDAGMGLSVTGDVYVEGTGSGTASLPVYPSNLFADLTNATPADIIDVRRAFALQRYQEARAQYGSRYTEYLRYLGINPQDARLQRPEYLGGGKQTVSFSEVIRTGAESTQTGAEGAIGELKGHGIAGMRSNRFRYFCQEHGVIISLLSIRPRTMYVNGLDRMWSKRTKEDYYQKELELIGQQEVRNSEVFVGTDDVVNKGTFGYQDRYSEYRHNYSEVAGEFRTLLDYWHLGRNFASLPVLNQSFIECDPSKRIFAEQTQHSCWVMVNHNIQARRMVGHQTIGRII